MKTILFATGNERKIAEAKLGCKIFDIEVKQVILDIPEIQSRNPEEISRNKAEVAFSKVQKPVAVTDTYWKFTALNGFPGAYMKDVNYWFTSNDFLNLMRDKKDKSVSFTESVSYTDGKDFKMFSKEYWGKIVDPPRGNGNSIENIAEFEGVTLGERRTQGGFSHKPEDYIWYGFARWFSRKK